MCPLGENCPKDNR